ncbi:uncharacterized protein LOC141660685 [Apium graveolens]|uniref:uncharacterized protein LOC141660685 n=1 Tax=Apium graveolens TaxID=4045 RepID=UPI003D7A4F24
MEKLVYALVVASRNLRHYFKGRLIKVMTDQPLKRILHKPDMTGRLAAWTVELSQFHIEYLPRSAVKSQILSDFVVECKFDTPIIEKTPFPQKAWILYVDGSSTTSSGGTEIFGDSQLVTKQLQGEFKAHDARMSTYLNLAMSLLEKVSSWTIKNICKKDNQWADALSKLTSSVVATSETIYVEERSVPSIGMNSPSLDMLKVIEISSIADWRQPILDYILLNKLPQDKGEARAISYKAKNYWLKKRVDELLRPWVDELPNVLWSYRTTPRSSMGVSPFKMAFGLEAVSPIEVFLNSPRVEYFDVEASREGIRLHNVLMEEIRDEASMRVLQQQARTTAYFNKKVKVKQFLVGDLVLRDSAASQPTITGKFKAPWEEPYQVTGVVAPGTYRLSTLEGTPIKNT